MNPSERRDTKEGAISDDDDDSIEAGWGFLLGGLSADAMTSTDWAAQATTKPAEIRISAKPDAVLPRQKAYDTMMVEAAAEGEAVIFDRAFGLSPSDGQLVQPPVRILDRSCEDKGNILVATKDIHRGQVIFTEKSLLGIQVPCSSTKHRNGMYAVRGCQNCFQSLEPASCLSSADDVEGIPLSELWPVPEYNKDSGPNGTPIELLVADNDWGASDTNMRLDAKSRRVSCCECGAIFCNRFCAKHHLQTVGDCCRCTSAIGGVVAASSRTQTEMLRGNNDLEERDNGSAPIMDIDPVLILACKMFLTLFHRYGQEKSSTGDRSCDFLSDSLFQGLCGEADDIPSLGLGSSASSSSASKNTNDNALPLQNEYNAIVNTMELTEAERNSDDLFSLARFHQLAAIAQRNAISLTTGSPFRTYYQAMIRKTGGRGSSRQQQVASEVARLLGSGDGKLTRDMDHLVEEKCVVKMGGLFTLTARMNHSCDPNAEIRGQEYLDCNIDIVAKKDIRRGEEICISYVNLGTNPSNSIIARNRRNMELRSRYLFDCQCSRCVN